MTPERQETVEISIRVTEEEERQIQWAAGFMGMSVNDFACHVLNEWGERNTLHSTLPKEAYEAFVQAITAPGKEIPGLHAAMEASAGILLDDVE